MTSLKANELWGVKVKPSSLYVAINLLCALQHNVQTWKMMQYSTKEKLGHLVPIVMPETKDVRSAGSIFLLWEV